MELVKVGGSFSESSLLDSLAHAVSLLRNQQLLDEKVLAKAILLMCSTTPVQQQLKLIQEHLLTSVTLYTTRALQCL